MNKEPKVRSIGKVLTAGSANTIYTCPPNYIAKMVLLFVSNHDISGGGGGGGGSGSTKKVTVQWNDVSAGQSYYIVGGYSLTATAFLKLDGSYLVLNPGDTLIVTPEAGSAMDTTVTVEEHYEQGLF
jgi:hypothetical protein